MSKITGILGQPLTTSNPVNSPALANQPASGATDPGQAADALHKIAGGARSSHPYFNPEIGEFDRATFVSTYQEEFRDMGFELSLNDEGFVYLKGRFDFDLERMLNFEAINYVEVLNLSDNNIGVDGARAIAESSALSKLTSLYLGGNNIGDDGARALAESSTLSNLTLLDLRWNFIGVEGTRAIAKSSALSKLTLLELAHNIIGDDGARALAESSTLSNLRSLNLTFNNIGDDGARALAESSTLSNLTWLYYTYGNNLDSNIRMFRWMMIRDMRVGVKGSTACFAEYLKSVNLESFNKHLNQIVSQYSSNPSITLALFILSSSTSFGLSQERISLVKEALNKHISTLPASEELRDLIGNGIRFDDIIVNHLIFLLKKIEMYQRFETALENSKLTDMELTQLAGDALAKITQSNYAFDLRFLIALLRLNSSGDYVTDVESERLYDESLYTQKHFTSLFFRLSQYLRWRRESEESDFEDY